MLDTGPIAYAWCFDHGRLHRFTAKEGPWCTAAWAPLEGATEEAALKYKQLMWGDAQFFGQLTIDRQGGLINLANPRGGIHACTDQEDK